MVAILSRSQCVNSSAHGDAIWWQRSGSTLAQVMAWCLTAPSHHLKQCWLLINEISWYSPGSNFAASIHAAVPFNEFEKCAYHTVTMTYHRGQWVNIRGLLLIISEFTDTHAPRGDRPSWSKVLSAKFAMFFLMFLRLSLTLNHNLLIGQHNSVGFQDLSRYHNTFRINQIPFLSTPWLIELWRCSCGCMTIILLLW